MKTTCCRCDDELETGRTDSYCRGCRRLYNREWNRKAPKETRERRRLESKTYSAKRRENDDDSIHLSTRKYKLRKFFGLTLEDYDRMLAAQNGVCGICGNPEVQTTIKGRSKYLAVDHNAETLKIRGLLCTNCNVGIGHLKHDVERLKLAIEYLNKYAE
jgi:hypothetical protein